MKSPRIRRASGVPFRWLDDRVILALPGKEDLESLDGTAAAVWDLLSEPMTVPELTKVLSDQYRAPRGRIARDVRSLIDTLKHQGSVEEMPGDERNA